MDNLRILITSRYGIDSYTKPLVDNIRHYCEVVCGADVFWESDANFDIVHIQWPEELFGWSAVTRDDLKRLENQIAYWKNKGAKLVVTRHNELPHVPAENNIALYKILENHCDGQIHMGNYSLEKLSYRNAVNVVIEHPHNIDLDLGLDKSATRKKYEIPVASTVYLLFGKIRKMEEEDAIIRNFVKFRRRDDMLYVSHSNIIQKTKSQSVLQRLIFGLRKKYLENNGVRFANKIYDNVELNELFTMADVVVISRIHNLNSGILYLSYSFKKLVIAPAIGNIKEKLLKNPFFVPKDDASIINAFEQARQSLKTDANLLNFEYVKIACDHEKIAREYNAFYKRILINETTADEN
jgi:hypothetical protein